MRQWHRCILYHFRPKETPFPLLIAIGTAGRFVLYKDADVWSLFS
jgi:hypothetical protein